MRRWILYYFCCKWWTSFCFGLCLKSKNCNTNMPRKCENPLKNFCYIFGEIKSLQSLDMTSILLDSTYKGRIVNGTKGGTVQYHHDQSSRLNQLGLSDLILDLDLKQEKRRTSVVMVMTTEVLQHDVKVSKYWQRQRDLLPFFWEGKQSSFLLWDNFFDKKFELEAWRNWMDSKLILKAVLLRIGNTLSSIAIGHLVHLNETYGKNESPTRINQTYWKSENL